MNTRETFRALYQVMSFQKISFQNETREIPVRYLEAEPFVLFSDVHTFFPHVTAILSDGRPIPIAIDPSTGRLLEPLRVPVREGDACKVWEAYKPSTESNLGPVLVERLDSLETKFGQVLHRLDRLLPTNEQFSNGPVHYVVFNPNGIQNIPHEQARGGDEEEVHDAEEEDGDLGGLDNGLGPYPEDPNAPTAPHEPQHSIDTPGEQLDQPSEEYCEKSSSSTDGLMATSPQDIPLSSQPSSTIITTTHFTTSSTTPSITSSTTPSTTPTDLPRPTINNPVAQLAHLRSPPILAPHDLPPPSYDTPPSYEHSVAQNIASLTQHLLLYEEHVPQRHKSHRWLSSRGIWRSRSPTTVEQFAYQLIELEMGLSWSAVSQTWVEERDTWLALVVNARTERHLAGALVSLERYTVVCDEEWVGMRDRWVNELLEMVMVPLVMGS